jgi:hypothetical protein
MKHLRIPAFPDRWSSPPKAERRSSGTILIPCQLPGSWRSLENFDWFYTDIISPSITIYS